MSKQPKKDAQGDTLGDGNSDASRRPRERLAGSVEKTASARLAEEARRAFEGADGDEQREPEEKGDRAEVPRK